MSADITTPMGTGTATVRGVDSTTPSGPSGQFVAGARAIVPMAIGVAPFGLAIGAAAAASNTPTAAALANAPLILAGAAQLTAIQMLDAGAAPVVIIASALMINARILLYSTSLVQWFRGESLGRRLVLAIPVIDQLHFTCVPRFEQGDLDRRERISFYAGAALVLLSTWLAANTAAILIGARLPEAAGLHVAAPLALSGLLAKSITDRRSMTASVVAAMFGVVACGLPFRSVVLVASIAGIAAGSFPTTADRRNRTEHTEVNP
jgi:predicted branched-subunit amino acid permease